MPTAKIQNDLRSPRQMVIDCLPATTPAILKSTGLRPDQVYRVLLRLHTGIPKQAHIIGYESTSVSGKGPRSAVYAHGPGADVPLPKLEARTFSRAPSATAREKEMLALLPATRTELSKATGLSVSAVRIRTERLVHLGLATVDATRMPWLFHAVAPAKETLL